MKADIFCDDHKAQPDLGCSKAMIKIQRLGHNEEKFFRSLNPSWKLNEF